MLQTDLGDELLRVHGPTGSSFRLNATVRLAWQRMPVAAEDLAAEYVRRFEVTAEVAARDALATLDGLVARISFQ